MNVVEVATKIRECIDWLNTSSKRIVDLAKDKALKSSEYEKEVAKTIIRLNNGEELEIDGKKVKDPAKSIIEKLARGYCYKKKLDMETADGVYKSAIAMIDSYKAQLNGWQSYNKHLDN